MTSLAELFIENADGLIISPENTEAVRASIDFALQQGQEVVFFESQLSDSSHSLRCWQTRSKRPPSRARDSSQTSDEGSRRNTHKRYTRCGVGAANDWFTRGA